MAKIQNILKINESIFCSHSYKFTVCEHACVRSDSEWVDQMKAIVWPMWIVWREHFEYAWLNGILSSMMYFYINNQMAKRQQDKNEKLSANGAHANSTDCAMYLIILKIFKNRL